MLPIIGVIAKPLIIFAGTVSCISTIQWASIQFLSNYCSPFNLSGFINNFAYLGSPLCLFVNNIQVQLSNYYITVWASASSSLLTYFGIKVLNIDSLFN